MLSLPREDPSVSPCIESYLCSVLHPGAKGGLDSYSSPLSLTVGAGKGAGVADGRPRGGGLGDRRGPFGRGNLGWQPAWTRLDQWRASCRHLSGSGWSPWAATARVGRARGARGPVTLRLAGTPERWIESPEHWQQTT
jgi:hypothetical protein